MKIKLTFHILSLLLIATACLGQPASSSVPILSPPATDSQLAQASETISVIVTAKNGPATAAGAVERLGGEVSSELWLIDAVAATLAVDQLRILALDPEIISIVENKAVQTAQNPPTGWMTNHPIPVPWDGRPDVQATTDPTVWQLVNPVAIDVGADLLHTGHGLTGQGITVAVLDSGLHFSPEVISATETHLATMFEGQVDFVGTGICQGEGSLFTGYCATDYTQSRDGYGHGTHVAGIIWNTFTDQATGVSLGIAPEAHILSVRVLNENGYGSYEDVIEGIQYVVANKDALNIRVLNMSLSAQVTAPYFVDPLNRAVEQAWASGIVVVVSVGNSGPGSETINVPGNDPYVITVGAVDGNRTPGYWADDVLPPFTSTGPTRDGFAKPDLLAPGMNIVSFMHNDPQDSSQSAKLVQNHPDYAGSSTLFRMNGTSVAAPIVSGVVALMLQADPSLTPDQVKYRLLASARPALNADDPPDLLYNILQQGRGRLWAPDAVLGNFPPGQAANSGMDIQADLAHGIGWVDTNNDGLVQPDEVDSAEMAYHYRGRIGRLVSDDGQAYLYYLIDENGVLKIISKIPLKPTP